MTTPLSIQCPAPAASSELSRLIEQRLSALSLEADEVNHCNVSVQEVGPWGGAAHKYRVEVELDLVRSTLISSRESASAFPEDLHQVVRRTFAAIERLVRSLPEREGRSQSSRASSADSPKSLDMPDASSGLYAARTRQAAAPERRAK